MAKTRKANPNKRQSNIRSELRQDLFAISLLALSAFIAVCLWQAPQRGDRNLLGAVGFFVYQSLQILFGQGKWLFVAALLLIGANAWLKTGASGKILYIAYTVAVLSVCAILQLRLPDELRTISLSARNEGGGVFGGSLSITSSYLIGKTGSWILYIALLTASVLLITGKTISELIKGAGGKARTIGHAAQSGLGRISSRRGAGAKTPDVIYSLNLPIDTRLSQDKSGKPPGKEEARSDFGDEALTRAEDIIAETGGIGGNGGNGGIAETGESGEPGGKNPAREGVKAAKSKTGDSRGSKGDGHKPAYKLPALSLLRQSPRMVSQKQSRAIADNARLLEKTLADFGVKATVTQVNRGPSITRFELQPEAGVKVRRIVSLSDDIALALAATRIRIEAPIPGKAAIGIEVPNEDRALVSLREILEDPALSGSWEDSKLAFALGRDIAGAPLAADLAKMPHLLIAGTTGSGKSVCVNAIIASILFRAMPDEVKMVMIDPKMVELTIYNGIPHLISPVVTNPKNAAKALRWAVFEMEKRYELFAKAGVRDITRYNEHIARPAGGDNDNAFLPQIVIIIDELSDLMMVAPADVEDSICRLAQMARAAGMHLVIATQRPSVDVITGLIKANIRSRIAFAVSSQIDSRVILDSPGAEKLLGKGDMLFSTFENPKPVRIQGVYVSDSEIENLTDYIKSTDARPEYQEDVLNAPQTRSDEDNDDEELDALLPEAARLFIESGQASISLLQRRFRIGYTRAARIIDQMEEQGIVGGYEGSKARVIRMTMAQYDERYGSKGGTQ